MGESPRKNKTLSFFRLLSFFPIINFLLLLLRAREEYDNELSPRERTTRVDMQRGLLPVMSRRVFPFDRKQLQLPFIDKTVIFVYYFFYEEFFFINCSLHLEIIRTCNTEFDRIHQFLDIFLCDMIVFTLLDYCFVLRKEKEGRLEVSLLRFLCRIFF